MKPVAILAELDREPAGAPATVTVPKMIDAEQVAELLLISKRHLMRLVHVGDFPRPMLIGRSARWPASDVTGYLQMLRTRRERKSKPARDV